MVPPSPPVSISLGYGEMQVCTHCIGSKHFSKWITENGKEGECDFEISHGHSNRVISIERLAIEVDNFFRENFSRRGISIRHGKLRQTELSTTWHII